MGMCALGDILQDKVDKLIGDIKGIKKYTDGVSVLSKDIFSKHMEKLRIIFGRFRAEGLKVNAHKCSFGLEERHYIGYLITWEGIKPNPKKVKGIMNLRGTTKTN